MERRHPPRATRAAAWIVTGPVGHAYGGLADWLVLAARLSWARARRREPGSAA